MNRHPLCLLFVLAFVVAESVSAAEEDHSLVDVVRTVSRGIVRIQVFGNIEELSKDGTISRYGTCSTGTGFIIVDDATPFIVTNWHVILGTPWKSSPRIFVACDDSSPNDEVELVGADELTDLAVLRRKDHYYDDAWKERSLVFGPASGDLRVGSSVLTIGYPRNQPGGPSVSRGIVSGLHRSMDDGLKSDLIQTDAAINPGNSGGPMVNLRGEVIGVNTYRFPVKLGMAKLNIPVLQMEEGLLALKGYEEREVVTSVDPTEGMNYARSITSVVPIVRTLIRSGRVDRIDLGFDVANLSREDAALFGLLPGALITKVQAQGPAALARMFGQAGHLTDIGLATGDVVTAIRWEHLDGNENSLQIDCWGDLLTARAQIPAESQIELTICRPSQTRIALIGEQLRNGWPYTERVWPADINSLLGLLQMNQYLTVKYTLPEK